MTRARLPWKFFGETRYFFSHIFRTIDDRSVTARISVCRELLDTSHHVAVVHVPAAHPERPLSQNALHVLAGASWRDVHHVRGHATRGNGAGVFQNPSLPVIGKVSPMGRAPCVGSKRGSMQGEISVRSCWYSKRLSANDALNRRFPLCASYKRVHSANRIGIPGARKPHARKVKHRGRGEGGRRAKKKKRRKVVRVWKQRIDRNNHSPSVFRGIRLIEASKRKFKGYEAPSILILRYALCCGDCSLRPRLTLEMCVIELNGAKRRRPAWCTDSSRFMQNFYSKFRFGVIGKIIQRIINSCIINCPNFRIVRNSTEFTRSLDNSFHEK